MSRSPESTPPEEVLTGPVPAAVRALREGRVSAVSLAHAAIARHEALDAVLGAYRHFDAEAALASARAADEVLDRARTAGQATGRLAPPPLCGIPVSVKDVYAVDGMPTFAGSARRLPDPRWSSDGWLVRRLREAGAVYVGKTHTVEFAYGGVGINPHGGTPRNPWDPDTARIPGGSSCGAAVSLHEGSAMLALGSDTGGSVRIPAAFNGVVGHKTTKGRIPTDGVTRLSSTFDTLGVLARTVEDAIWFFGCADPRWGDPEPLLDACEATTLEGLRIAIPRCRIWEACQADVAAVVLSALADLGAAGARLERPRGTLIDDANEHYMRSGIGKAEIHAFLSTELPEWLDLLHPTVGDRIVDPLSMDGETYREALAKHRHLAALADTLFGDADVLALPTNLITPPPVEGLADDLARYTEVNLATLRPTCPANLLGLCAISIPVGLDQAGMPVGLQLLGRADEDEALLGVALAVERRLGTGAERLGKPPLPGERGGAA